MRIQVREYVDFIKNFTENTDIMSKSFFIIVPYTPSILEQKKGPFSLLGRNKKIDPEAKSRSFEENRTQLQQRVSVVEQGLSRTGVRTVQLGTEEVVELLYKLFNPGELEKPIPLGSE